nr:CMF_HP1_G0046300.mRNA.1.CDS.1 [Saccharomyces cerevisiae]
MLIKWIDIGQYEKLNKRYHQAKTSFTDRKIKVDEAGAEIEDGLNLLGNCNRRQVTRRRSVAYRKDQKSRYKNVDAK